MGMRRAAALWTVATCAAAFATPLVGPANAQSALCDNPAEQCGRQIAPDCLQRLGAGAITADTPALCTAQLEVYRDCLTRAVERCPGASTEEITATDDTKPRFKQDYDFGRVHSTMSAEGFEFALQGCIRRSGRVSCSVVVNDTNPERELMLRASYSGGTRLYASSGVAYAAESVRIGERSDRGSMSRDFPQDIPVQAVFEFTGADLETGAGSPLFQLNVTIGKRHKIDFRNVAFD